MFGFFENRRKKKIDKLMYQANYGSSYSKQREATKKLARRAVHSSEGEMSGSDWTSSEVFNEIKTLLGEDSKSQTLASKAIAKHCWSSGTSPKTVVDIYNDQKCKKQLREEESERGRAEFYRYQMRLNQN